MGSSEARAARAGAPQPYGSRLLGPDDQSPRALRIRVQLVLTWLLISTNVIGAGVVFVISAFVVPAPAPTDATKLSLAIAVPVYVVVAVGIGASVGTATTVRALRWILEDRPPTERDRMSTLRAPLRLTRLQSLLWTSAAVLFTVLAVVVQPSRAVSTMLTVTIAGFVVSAVAYLLTQFTVRPIAARALEGAPLTDRPRGVGVGDRMVIFWGLGTALPLVGLMIAAILALTGDQTSLTSLAVLVLALGGVVLLFGLFITVLNARSVVAPVVSVRDALLAVESGDLDHVVPVYDGTELGQLQSGFNQMVTGLREREHLRDLFGRHVGQDVARAAAEGEIELGGQTVVASVLFIDLIGSTTYAAEHDAQDVVEVLNRFFGVVVDEVSRHDGLVNKFIGDAVLAIFGAPVEHDDHAGAALAAARTMAARLAEEVPEVGAGIGVATGEVVAGNVGAASRFEYTVIGDAVNSAARLTDLAKEVPGKVLVARASVEGAAGDEAQHWADHGELTLRGRDAATTVSILAGSEDDPAGPSGRGDQPSADTAAS